MKLFGGRMETKEEYLGFLLEAKENSEILFNNGKYHMLVYIGGYTLETFFKYINLKYSLGINRMGHDIIDGLSNINSKITSGVYEIEPKILDLLDENNCDFPRKLLDGEGDILSWNPNKRYKINTWNDKEFAKKISLEIANIYNIIVEMKINGII